MKLSISSIRRLYGPRLYILREIPSEDTSQVMPQPGLFIEGDVVEWKMKPTSQLSLILNEEEFTHKDLIPLLKSMVLKAQISTDLVGFGVFNTASQNISLLDMPTVVGILFGPPGDGLPDSLRVEDRDLFVLPSLQNISEQADHIDLAIQTLQRAKFLLKP